MVPPGLDAAAMQRVSWPDGPRLHPPPTSTLLPPVPRRLCSPSLGERGATEEVAQKLGDPILPHSPTHVGRVVGSPPSAFPRLVPGQRNRGVRSPKATARSRHKGFMAPRSPQPRSHLFPLSLSLSSKGQQEGRRKSPSWLGEGAWETGASFFGGIGMREHPLQFR